MTMENIIENLKAMQHYSGKVVIENDIIYWEGEHKKTVQILLNEIAIIGEYTTFNTVNSDDWFMVFLNKKAECQKVSMYAEGINILRKELATKFQTSIHGKLYASTTWDSNIVYPKYLKNEKLFDFSAESTGLISDKLRRILGLERKTKITLNATIKNYCLERM